MKIKFTAQDPCQIVRKSYGDSVADDLRFVVKNLVGEENFVDMYPNKSNNYCCGGGGGRIWMDTPQEDRFSDIRLHQAKEAGAGVLATACPYCITNFEESRLNLEFEDVLEVKDIAEIVSEVSG